MRGKCSYFGGIDDKGMGPRPGMPNGDTGLAFYEPHEANKRHDIFHKAPEGEPNQQTWKRLRLDFPYIAMRFDKTVPRTVRREMPYKITNIKTGKWAIGFPVDWGPGIETRLIDVSPGLMARLGLTTDDEVEVEELT